MNATDLTLSLALLLAAVAAWCDLRTGHIPNQVTLGGLALGSVLQIFALCWAERSVGHALSLSFVALASARALIGIVVCALIPYLLFLRNGIGGGDVKLLAALGGTLGPVVGLEVELYAFVALLLFAGARLAYAGRLAQVIGNAAALLANPLLPKERKRLVTPDLLSSFKFAPAVFVAAACVCALRWGNV